VVQAISSKDGMKGLVEQNTEDSIKVKGKTGFRQNFSFIRWKLFRPRI
jgi:hypothetical protein